MTTIILTLKLNVNAPAERVLGVKVNGTYRVASPISVIPKWPYVPMVALTFSKIDRSCKNLEKSRRLIL